MTRTHRIARSLNTIALRTAATLSGLALAQTLAAGIVFSL